MRDLIDHTFAEHDGRLVKTTGDGSGRATRCALETQRSMMIDRNAELPSDKRIEYRIGKNLRDIILEGWKPMEARNVSEAPSAPDLRNADAPE
jgi:adenylate cyclase